MNRLQHRRSSTAGVVPTLAQMLEAEIAINTADKDVFFSTGTEVVQLNHLKNAKSDATHRTVTDTQIEAWSTSQAALGYTPVNREGDTMTGPFYLASAPTVSNGAATKGYVDQSVALISGTYRAPVQTLAGLTAVSPSGLPDKALCLVEDEGSLYHFDAQSEVEGNGTTVIAPSAGGTGRWFKMQSATASHEALSGLQGGEAGDHLHLSSAEYNAVTVHYADLDLHLSAEQNTLLDQLVVDAVEINALDGITSNVQEQLSGKQDAIGYAPLSKGGDTMTGPLILSRNPEASAEAATKDYVDQSLLNVNTYADQASAGAVNESALNTTTVVEAASLQTKNYVDTLVVEAAQATELFASNADTALSLQTTTDIGSALDSAKLYTDQQIAAIPGGTSSVTVEYVGQAAAAAVTDAATYTDQQIALLPSPTGTSVDYVDQAVADGVIAAGTYTDQAIAALPTPTGVTTAELNTAVSNGVTEAATYTDQAIAAIPAQTSVTALELNNAVAQAVVDSGAYTDQVVSAIVFPTSVTEAYVTQAVQTSTTANEAYVDQALVDAAIGHDARDSQLLLAAAADADEKGVLLLQAAATDATDKSIAAVEAAGVAAEQSLTSAMTVAVQDYTDRDTQAVQAAATYTDQVVAAVPYDLHGALYGVVGVGEVLLRIVMARPCALGVNFGTSIAVAGTAATTAMEFAVRRNGTQFGTLTFGTATALGVFASTVVENFVRGDVLEIVNLTGVEDTTLSDVSMMIAATM